MKKVSSQFESAVKEIRKQGVMARRNVSSCCRGCVDLKVADDQAIIWHFGGQGNAFQIFADGAMYRDYSNCEGVYFNHSGIAGTEKGQAVMEIFAKHGIVTEWDGSEGQCIYVDFKATAKAFQIEQAEISINAPEAVLV